MNIFEKLMIDQGLRLILKATKYDLLVAKISILLSKTQSAEIRIAVLNIIRDIKLKDGVLTDTLIDQLDGNLNQYLEINEKDLQKELENQLKNVYIEEKGIRSLNYQLTAPDKRAISALQQSITPWVADNDIKNQVVQDIKNELIKARQLGLTRNQTALQLERTFGDLVPKSLSEKYGSERYWEGFVRQHATRSRSFADIQTYRAAGITQYQIWARMNERTCQICGSLHGRVFAVADAESRLNSYYEASKNGDVSAMKKAVPWVYSDPDKDAALQGLIPALHFRCQCHLRSYKEKLGDHTAANGQVNLADSGKEMKFVNRKHDGKPQILREKVLYSTLDNMNRQVFFTDKSLEHCKEKIGQGSHLKYNQKDESGYKNVMEAVKKPAALFKHDSGDLVYIGENGYIVIMQERSVKSAYFGGTSTSMTLDDVIGYDINDYTKRKGYRQI